jgi:exosortase/archaeosortase family protein
VPHRRKTEASDLRLWSALVALAVAYHFALLISSRASLANLLFVALVWAVAHLPFEELRPQLHFAPSRAGFWCGGGLLVALLLRFGLAPAGDDALIYLAPPLLGLALVLLCRPPRELGRFRELLLILATTPLLVWVPPALLLLALSRITAGLSTLLLALGGFDVVQVGTVVDLGGAGVNVSGPCSGSDMIAQAVLVGALALILIPLPKRWLRLPFLLLAPLCMWLVNGLRISLLAWLALRDPAAAAADSGLFRFFHQGHGGLLFSVLGIGIYVLIYNLALNHLLRDQES